MGKNLITAAKIRVDGVFETRGFQKARETCFGDACYSLSVERKQAKHMQRGGDVSLFTRELRVNIACLRSDFKNFDKVGECTDNVVLYRCFWLRHNKTQSSRVWPWPSFHSTGGIGRHRRLARQKCAIRAFLFKRREALGDSENLHTRSAQSAKATSWRKETINDKRTINDKPAINDKRQRTIFTWQLHGQALWKKRSTSAFAICYGRTSRTSMCHTCAVCVIICWSVAMWKASPRTLWRLRKNF